MNALDMTLYGILDPNRTRGRDLVQLAHEAASGGVTLLQYRDKNSDTRTLVDNARLIAKEIEPFGVPLLINDRVDVALAAGAHGVHIGQSDMTTADARRLLGADAIIGLTIKTTEHAQAAPVELLDYVCIGGVYDTLSKDNPLAIGIDGWQQCAAPFRKNAPHMPVGAIAGIDATNIRDVIKAGADGAAIISALFMQDDVEAAARLLLNEIREARK